MTPHCRADASAPPPHVPVTRVVTRPKCRWSAPGSAVSCICDGHWRCRRRELKDAQK